jgi:hypothetical protein
MKAIARPFSMTAFAAALTAAAFAAAPGAAQGAQSGCAGVAADPAVAGPPQFSPAMTAQLAAAHPFPDFCSIPPMPTNVPTAQTYKTAVVQTRVAGARLVRRTGPPTWSLQGTAGFAEAGRREAAPPPPMTPAPDTQAFIDEMRARATPPPKPH